jgi:hypothetical protein
MQRKTIFLNEKCTRAGADDKKNEIQAIAVLQSFLLSSRSKTRLVLKDNGIEEKIGLDPIHH